MFTNPIFFLSAFITGVSITIAMGLYRQPENRWKSYILVVVAVLSAWTFTTLLN